MISVNSLRTRGVIQNEIFVDCDFLAIHPRLTSALYCKKSYYIFSKVSNDSCTGYSPVYLFVVWSIAEMGLIADF